MSKVMIRCPNTGESVSTGLEIDQAAFDASEFGDLAFECPECPEIHAWSKADAFLRE